MNGDVQEWIPGTFSNGNKISHLGDFVVGQHAGEGDPPRVSKMNFWSSVNSIAGLSSAFVVGIGIHILS